MNIYKKKDTDRHVHTQYTHVQIHPRTLIYIYVLVYVSMLTVCLCFQTVSSNTFYVMFIYFYDLLVLIYERYKLDGHYSAIVCFL